MKDPASCFIMTELPAEYGVDPFLKTQFTPSDDIVVISDNPAATPGLDALVRSKYWLEQGFRVAVHLNCRDRNRIDIVSRYNGALFWGIDYIIVETGYHTSRGLIPEAKPVYDLDPIQTVAYLKSLPRTLKIVHHRTSKLGLRTPVQELDEFELRRMTAIFSAKPDFLVLHSHHNHSHVTAWIKYCKQLAGFKDIQLVWEKTSDSCETDESFQLPEGIHGVLLKY